MKTLAIVIRGKHSEDHNPDLLAQHADVVLSDGAPMGYFGEGGGIGGSSGIGMQGIVYDYYAMQQKRRPYVDAPLAAAVGMLSTICTIQVEDDVAKKFDDYWRNLKAKGEREEAKFSLVGNNCSTNAAAAFRHAGVIKGGVPGLDTPQNLYHHLRFRYGARFQCASGYVGFTKTGNQYETQVIKP